MKLPRFRLAELALAVLFIGLSAGPVARAWGGYMFAPGLASAAAILFPVYFLLVITMRQRREGSGRGRTDA
jgi:hypothetical protein